MEFKLLAYFIAAVTLALFPALLILDLGMCKTRGT